jgi:transposase-like protein
LLGYFAVIVIGSSSGEGEICGVSLDTPNLSSTPDKRKGLVFGPAAGELAAMGRRRSTAEIAGAVAAVRAGESMSAVARRLHVQPSTVLTWCRVAGVRSRYTAGRELAEPDRNARIRERLAAGESTAALARDYGISRQRIQQICGL